MWQHLSLALISVQYWSNARHGNHLAALPLWVWCLVSLGLRVLQDLIYVSLSGINAQVSGEREEV